MGLRFASRAPRHLALSALAVSLTVTGCGGGSRGTGIGGIRNTYESTFIGGEGHRPEHPLLTNPDDERCCEQSEPCPLSNSKENPTCKWRAEILEMCLIELGEKIPEGSPAEQCAKAESLAPYVKEKLTSAGREPKLGSCQYIRKLCVYDFGEVE